MSPSRGVVLMLMLTVVLSTTALAAAGVLDVTFSGDGRQTTEIGPGNSGATAVAVQSDGKIVVAGNSGADFALARYAEDGSLDPEFSDDGVQTTEFGAQHGANDLAIQPDGKIVAVGRAAGRGLAIARYDTDGSLDTGFSDDGKQTANVGSGEANAVAVQPNGKIVVAGSGGAIGLSSSSFTVARFRSNGKLDRGFAGDGIQTITFGRTAEARDLAIQSDGRIVLAGFSGTYADFALARVKSDGSLDSTFSGDGRQTTGFLPGTFDYANGVALQANGKIVAAGSTAGGPFRIALARYRANGTLDPGFSRDGRQMTTVGGGEPIARAVAIQGDGKIVAAGVRTADDGSRDFVLSRYDLDGRLDPTFSGDGRQVTSFGGRDEANDVAVRPDGRIVAAGITTTAANTEGRFAVARYLGN